MAVASLAELRRQQAGSVKSLGDLQREQSGEIATETRDPILGRRVPYRLNRDGSPVFGLDAETDDPLFGTTNTEPLWGTVVGGELKEDPEGKLGLWYHINLGVSPEMAMLHSGDLTEAVLGEKLTPETALGRIKENYRLGQLQVQLSDLGMQVLNNRDTPQTWAEIERLRAEMPSDVRAKFRPLWEKMLSSASEQVPIMAEGVKAAPGGAAVGGATGAIIGSTISLSPTIGEEAAIPALTWAGMKLGGGLATAERIGEIEAGLCVLDLLDNDIPPEIAKPAAIGVGIINGALETSQINDLLATLPGGKALGRKAMARTINKVLKEGTLRNLAGRHAAQFGTYLGKETLQELAQESTNVVAEEFTKALSTELTGREYEYATLMQIRDRMLEVGAKSLQGFTVLGLPGSTVSAIVETDVTLQRQRLDTWFNDWLPDDRASRIPPVIADVPAAGLGVPDERSELVSPVAEKGGQDDRAVQEGVLRRGGERQPAGRALPDEGRGREAAQAGGVLETAEEVAPVGETDVQRRARESREQMAAYFGDPAETEAGVLEAALDELSYEALAEKARRIGVEVRGKKAQLGALIADAIRMKAGSRQRKKGDLRVRRTRLEQRALVETERAILKDPLYQEMDRAAQYQEADIQMGLENRTRKGRVDPSFVYYVDPGYRGDVEGATGKLGAKGYKAKLAKHITYTKGEGGAWDTAMQEQGLDYDFSQFLAELESSLYATETGHAGINEAALDAALDEAVAANQYGIALLAEKRRLLLLGTGAYTVNEELVKMAAAMRIERGDIEDLLIGEGKLLNAEDPHPGSLTYREFFDRLGQELMDADSEWMRTWHLPGQAEKPRQMWKRLKAEWEAINAHTVAADLNLAQILAPERELTEGERAEIAAIDAEKVADTILKAERATLYERLIQGIFDDAAEFRRLRTALHKAYREGHAEGIRAAREAYRAHDQKIKARHELRETIGKIMREIRRPAGKTIAVAQREAILEIQESIDPQFRAKRTLAERQAAREYFGEHPEARAPEKVRRLLASKSLGEFTVEELEQLARAVRELRQKGKILQNQRHAQRAATTADDTRAVIDAVTGGVPFDPDTSPVVGPPDESLWRRAKGLYAMTLTPERLLDWLDGVKDFTGAMFRIFWERVANAEKAKLRRIEERIAAAKGALARCGLTVADLARPVLTIRGDRTLSAEQCIGIYNFARNYKSGLAVTFGNRIGRRDQARAIEYVERTDPRLKALADWIVAHYGRHYARLREAVIIAEDRDMGSEENYTPMRRMESDYTPDERQIVTELMQRHHLKRGYAEKGMTIQRQDIKPEHQKPIRLDGYTLLLEQIERQEHYIAYAEVTKGLREVITDDGVVNAILEKAGRSVYQQVRGYVDAVANPNIYRTFSQVERWSKTLRRNASIAYLAYKLSTVLKQLPSVLLVLPEAGTDLVVAGLEAMQHPMEVRRFVVDRDPMVRHATLERELEEMRVARPGEYNKVLKRFGETGLKGLYVTDAVARTIAWYGVYVHQLKAATKAGMDPAAADVEATRQARLAISRTQPGARAFQLPELYRSNEILNALLQFTNQLNKLWNIATYDTLAHWKNQQYQRAAMSFVALGVNSLAIWAITNRRLPEDEEDLADALSEQFINTIPVVGRGIVAYERGFGAGGLPMIEGAAEFAVNLKQAAEDLAVGQIDAGTLEKAYRGAAPILGLPYTGPKNILDTALTGDPVHLLGGEPTEKKGAHKTKASVTASRRRTRRRR